MERKVNHAKIEWENYGAIPESASPTSSISHISIDVRNQWYPIALSKEIKLAPKGKRGKPFGTCILGDPVVLYRDAQRHVRCFADKCPHRSAPLSVGQVVNGILECKYHGWQFDESGAVSYIPALQKGKKIPTSAKTRAYPCREEDGCVFVWPGDVGMETEKLPYFHPVQHEQSFTCQSFSLDLPIDHTLMVENLLDPAHIPFTHEGTIGQRSKAEPLKMMMTKIEQGIRGQVKAGFFNTFIAPCWVILYTPIRPGWRMVQICGCTPSAPGRMRFVYRTYRNFGTWIHSIPFLGPIFDKFSLKIVFQDYEMLFGQQQRLNEGALPWNSAIQVDNLPVLYRKWATKAFQSAYWNGWNPRKLLDVEDLAKSARINCDGCNKSQPYHPLNPFQKKNSTRIGRWWISVFVIPILAILLTFLWKFLFPIFDTSG